MRVSTLSLGFTYILNLSYYLIRKWVIDAMAPDKKDNAVKAKQLEALKRLGHSELKLDEYERM